jgi:hypothetical protein
LGDDQRGDDPMECFRNRAVARRWALIWHTSDSA